MMTLFDMIEQAQKGGARRNLASQFGLSEDQVGKALEALMPAFSAGLKQNTSGADGLQAFVSALASGRHADYYDDPVAAFSRGQDEGNQILGHMFGSKDASRAVAAQAAQVTGIGQQILKQMLPVVASMVMGGLFKQSSPGTSAGGAGYAPSGSGNMLRDIMEQMLRGGLGGGSSGAAEPLRREGDFRHPTPRGEDIFGKMFDAGREVQEGYGRGMESLIDGFLSGMDRRRR